MSWILSTLIYKKLFEDEYGRVSLKISTVKFQPKDNVSLRSRSQNTNSNIVKAFIARQLHNYLLLQFKYNNKGD